MTGVCSVRPDGRLPTGYRWRKVGDCHCAIHREGGTWVALCGKKTMRPGARPTRLLRWGVCKTCVKESKRKRKATGEPVCRARYLGLVD